MHFPFQLKQMFNALAYALTIDQTKSESPTNTWSELDMDENLWVWS